jgi:hypothetical protein
MTGGHGKRGVDPGHLRVDLRTRDDELRQRPDRVVPEVRRLRAVLRRSDQLQPVRADVAVVGGGVSNGVGDFDQIDGARLGG